MCVQDDWVLGIDMVSSRASLRNTQCLQTWLRKKQTQMFFFPSDCTQLFCLWCIFQGAQWQQTRTPLWPSWDRAEQDNNSRLGTEQVFWDVSCWVHQCMINRPINNTQIDYAPGTDPRREHFYYVTQSITIFISSSLSPGLQEKLRSALRKKSYIFGCVCQCVLFLISSRIFGSIIFGAGLWYLSEEIKGSLSKLRIESDCLFQLFPGICMYKFTSSSLLSAPLLVLFVIHREETALESPTYQLQWWGTSLPEKSEHPNMVIMTK